MRRFLLFHAVILLSACKFTRQPESIRQVDSVVFASAETLPVMSTEGEDAADDPAIWVNPVDPAMSLIVGTNKKAGLYLYSLSGEELAFYPVGKVNNVDIRYGFTLTSGKKADLAGASNRSDNSIVLMAIEPASLTLRDISARKVISGLAEVYGFAFYHSRSSGRYFAFVVGKDGKAEQWELLPAAGDLVDLKLIRTFSFDTQAEGLVADDETGKLYIAEERNCIWKIDAEPDKPVTKSKIALSDSLNPRIVYDLEGLAIYYGSKPGKGYLIASVQGNFTYALFEREGENRYLGSFSIGERNIDSAEETDGLEVTALSLGEKFPHGALVVQDGFNYDADSLVNQNFKIVPWESIARLFVPNLETAD